MIETIILAVIVLVLIVLLGFQDYRNAKERQQLINRIIAKDANEVISLDLADKQPKQDKEVVSDLVQADSLSDDDFDSMIKKQITKLSK